MKLRLRLSFLTDGDEKFFGEGPYRLLKGVQDHGSLRASAQSMDMAYTKAFKIIRNAETALGFPLIQRTIGGRGGGGSELTQQAGELLKCYESYRSACNDMALQLYKEHFSGLQMPTLAPDGTKEQRQDDAG